jgi:hypothetical protein
MDAGGLCIPSPSQHTQGTCTILMLIILDTRCRLVPYAPATGISTRHKRVDGARLCGTPVRNEPRAGRIFPLAVSVLPP